MEININLADNTKKHLIHIAIGVVFILVGLIYMMMKIRDKSFDQFDWAYLGFYGIIGFKYLIQGLIEILRKAYVIINNEKIALKPDTSTKGKTIFWKDILTIKQVGKNYEIRCTDNTSFTIYLSHYSYKVADEIKLGLETIAAEKAILIEAKMN
ncbi:MAG: hypothetical protein H6Q19_1760 [Bacteroidetes bacterium]|nr:hypothetical protein [Bacteroidota bacterium]